MRKVLRANVTKFKSLRNVKKEGNGNHGTERIKKKKRKNTEGEEREMKEEKYESCLTYKCYPIWE